MSHVKLDPYRLALGGDDLTSISNALESATNSLVSSLQRVHGAAGDDENAELFWQGYKPFGDSVLNSTTAAVNLMRMLDASIGNTAATYQAASAAGSAGGGGATVVVQPMRAMSKPSLPDMRGVGRVRGLGEFQEVIEGVLANLSIVLPDGDGDKLRTAQAAWVDFEDALRSARLRLLGSMQYLGATDFPQDQTVRSSINRVVYLIQTTETDANATAGIVDGQADNIDSTWQQINDFLVQMAIELAIDIGITAALAIFTVGVGAVAGLAKMTLTITRWAIKIKNLIDKLHALTKMGGIARQLLTRAAMGAAENVVIGMGTTFIMDVQDGELNANYGATFVTSVVAGGAGGAASGLLARVLPTNPSTLKQAIGLGAIDGAVNGGVSGAVSNMSNSLLTGSEFNPLSGAFWGTLSGGIGGAAGGGIDHGAGKLGDFIDGKSGNGSTSSTSTTTANTDKPNDVNLPTSLDGDSPKGDGGGKPPTPVGGPGGNPSTSGGVPGGGHVGGGDHAGGGVHVAGTGGGGTPGGGGGTPGGGGGKPNGDGTGGDGTGGGDSTGGDNSTGSDTSANDTGSTSSDGDTTSSTDGGGTTPSDSNDSGGSSNPAEVPTGNLPTLPGSLDGLPGGDGTGGGRPGGDDTGTGDIDTHSNSDGDSTGGDDSSGDGDGSSDGDGDGDSSGDGDGDGDDDYIPGGGDDGNGNGGDGDGSGDGDGDGSGDPDKGDSGLPPFDPKDMDNVYEHSIHNGDASTVMLGSYHDGGPTSYMANAENGMHSYFSLTKEQWDSTMEANGWSGPDGNAKMYEFLNERFLDDAMADRKSFYFSDDPRSTSVTPTLLSEYEHIKSNPHYAYDEGLKAFLWIG